jgi:hypothetical protein
MSTILTRRSRSRIELVIAVAVAVLAFAATAASAHGSRPLHGTLLGAFSFGPCPADAPAGAACLHDELSGSLKGVGPVTGAFDVAIDAAHADEHGVAPIAKLGSFVARNGDRLDVAATGSFDFGASVATYTYTVTGGTGRFSHATGSGSWLVPAPAVFDPATGQGSGDEILDGTLELHRVRARSHLEP